MFHNVLSSNFSNAEEPRSTMPVVTGLYCLWYVTLIGLDSAPTAISAVLSFAVIACCSVSYSTNAIPFLPGTLRISLNPSKRSKIAVSASVSTSLGRFCTNRILFGGRYSAGITAAPEGLAGRAFAGSPPEGWAAFFWVSTASRACLRSKE